LTETAKITSAYLGKIWYYCYSYSRIFRCVGHDKWH
jgi:hypothetical protein